MTVFKRSMLSLGLAALGFSFVLMMSILILMDSLYYEINAVGLRKAAAALYTAIGEERIKRVFTDNIDGITRIYDIPVNRESDYRLSLVAPTGYVLFDSYVIGDLVNHIDRIEIETALGGEEKITRRVSVTLNVKRLYFAKPVFNAHNEVIGVFRLSFSVPDFRIRMYPIIIPFFIFMLFITLAVFWAVFVFSRSLSISIGRLVNTTQAAASLLSGSGAEPVLPEFRSLEKAIRSMTSELNIRLEQAKAESYRLEAILNGMSEAVFATDNNLILYLVNPKARILFNLGARDINASPMSLLEAARSSELSDAAKNALLTEKTLDMELTFRSGTEQYFQAFISPLGGAESGVVIVLQDITRLIKLEKVRKDFVANVSHELRTPIQLIKGFSETLHDTIAQADKIGKKQLIHIVKIISKNAATMENLANDLLVLADLENNSPNNRDMEDVSLAYIIDEALSSVEMQIKKKQIEIIVDCPNKLRAKLYSFFVIQALINMIDNAVKYSSFKSKIWVSAYLEDKNIVLQVRDKGIGIPSEHLGRIFERFYRVDRSRSKKAGGTGLGLSIVRHIAMMHKGKAEAESQSGEGSVFRIKLPLV